jgi:hypothetical protein
MVGQGLMGKIGISRLEVELVCLFWLLLALAVQVEVTQDGLLKVTAQKVERMQSLLEVSNRNGSP